VRNVCKGFPFRWPAIVESDAQLRGEQWAQVDEVKAKENELLSVQCGPHHSYVLGQCQ
jgi:hypothetical protein